MRLVAEEYPTVQPAWGQDRVVGDEAALFELEDQAGITCLRICETRSPTDRHLAGQANRSPR